MTDGEIYEIEHKGEKIKVFDRDGDQIRVLKNGALRSMTKGKLVKGGKITTQITKENAREMALRGIEKRRAVVIAAANDAVERADFKIQFGEYAFIAAMASNAMIKATTPEDPKAIEAARYILAQAGFLNDDVEESEKNQSVLAALGREAVEQLLARAKREREIIDAD